MTGIFRGQNPSLWARGFIVWALMMVPVSVAWAGDSTYASPSDIPSTALVMVTSSSCPWCDAFEDEVGYLYDKTKESQKYPIYRIDFFSKFPERLGHIAPAQFTPTFIVIEDDKEIGRLVGYPGDEMFWWRFSEFTE